MNLITEGDLIPDKNCQVCGGSGCMLFKDRQTICECIIRKKVKDYLGPLYAKGPYADDLNFDENNIAICFEKCDLNKFKSLVKSFLLYHKLKVTHKSVFPQDIIQYYVTDGSEAKQNLSSLTEVDLLVVYFIQDPPNKLYGEMIEGILEKRRIFNKVTWIYSTDKIGDIWFTEKYSYSLSQYLNKYCGKFKKLNRVDFNKGVKK